MQTLSRVSAWALLCLGVACGGAIPTPPAATPPPAQPASAAVSSDAPQIVFLGDSLTAGLGLDASLSFPSLIEARLEREGYRYRVVNAGVSGDTSAGGLRRLQWALDGRPTVLLVALGANDALRGLPPDDLEKNLAAIITQAQQAGLQVVLAGMAAPPNNGPDYTAKFRAVYADLAREFGVPLIPFLLEGVAGDAALNQADGIHPNARGAARVADTVWSALSPLLTRSTPTP